MIDRFNEFVAGGGLLEPVVFIPMFVIAVVVGALVGWFRR